MRYYLLLFLFITQQTIASNPSIAIQSPTQHVTFTRSQLLSRPEVTTVITTDDPYFPAKKMVYKAIPTTVLFQNITIPDDATITFQTLDHFSAPITKEHLLNTSSYG